MDAGREPVISTAQQRQFLLQEGGFFAQERKQGGGDIAIGFVGCADANGRVGRVGQGVVAHKGIEVAEVACGQQQRAIGWAIVIAGVDAEGLTAVKQRFVNLDQAGVGDGVGVESHVAFPAVPGLADNAGGGVHRVVEQVAGALVEGIDPGQHAFDVSFGQCRRGPGRPIGIGRVGQGVGLPIPHRDVIVAQGLNPGGRVEGVVVDVVADGREWGPGARVGGWGLTVHRR